MFITAVCFIFLIKLRWPKTKSLYLSQFVSEMVDSTKCAPQYELNSSVTMTTYSVPDLPILKAFLATIGVTSQLSRLIGDHPWGLTKEQTTETMDPGPKTKGLRLYPRQWN